LSERLGARWALKGLATTGGIAAFLAVYFLLVHHPVFPVTTMPLTPVDHWVTVSPASLPLYLSLWLYVSIGPALLKSDRELYSYAIACLAMSLIGFAVFLLWPTAVPQDPLEWAHHPALASLKAADMSTNAFPSMHVAFATFTAVWLARIGREMGAPAVAHLVNGLWWLGILYSTVATRQHVVIDVLGGALLAAAVVALQMRRLDRVRV
jgi:membrane-associated phospholipid phosphatase